MEERLLLDGIALHAAHVSPWDKELAATVIANLANTLLAFGDRAVVSAGKAADSAAFDWFVKLAFANLLVQNFLEGRHGDTLFLF